MDDRQDSQTYRVVLYGHTVDDEALFCRRLAALLDTTEQGARKRVERKPVVLKRGLSERSAESLNQTLTSIGGLCLVQPEGNVAVDGPIKVVADSASKPEYGGGRERRAGLSRNMVAALIGVLGVGIIAGMLFLVQMKMALESNESDEGKHIYITAPPLKPEARPAPDIARPALSRSEIKEQIAALEPDILATRQSLQLREKELRKLYEAPLLGKEPFLEKRKQVKETRTVLQSYLSRVRSLQKELRRLDQLEKEKKRAEDANQGS